MMTFKRSGEVFHVGTTLGLAHTYLGDEVSLNGVYYWDEEKNEVMCDQIDMSPYYMERTIDASPEMQEKAHQWLRGKVKAYILELLVAYTTERSTTITNGDTVCVVKGRKIPKGTRGIVFWNGETRYGSSVGIRFSDKKDSSGKYIDVEFTAPINLKVMNPPTYTLTDVQIEEICNYCATIGCYPMLHKNVERSVQQVLGITQLRY